jgi:L-alanine-DL-glutamate epimerase-like enolase superfamily enzyme
VLQELAELEIHSIEQPIKKSEVKNQKPEDSLMAKLCAETPTPIALDEELIGIIDYEERKNF